jgi:hypothetical protein
MPIRYGCCIPFTCNNINQANRCHPYGRKGPFGCNVLVVDGNRCPVPCTKVILTNRQCGVSLRGTTNRCGRISFSCLPPGKYICTLASDSEYGRSVSVVFCLNCCNPCQNVCLTTVALRCSNKIIVKLRSDNPGGPLEGGTFKLFKENGEFVRMQTTNEKGIAVFSNLPMGEYYLIQSKAPHGYEKEKRKYHIILDKNNKCETVIVINKKACKCICLCLKTCKCKKPICGAEFCLYDSYHKKIGCAKTNRRDCLVFKHLSAGKYYIKQISTKHGYEVIRRPICVHLSHYEKCEKVKVCNRKKHCPRDRKTVEKEV